MKCLLFVGTYTRPVGHVPGANAEGIYTYQLNLDTGELSYIAVTGGMVNPSFLTVDSRGRFLYAVSEMEDGSDGSLAAYAINSETGTLTFINQQSTLGDITAYVSLDKTDRFAFVANYGGSRAAAVVLPIREDGSLGPASDSVAHQGSGPVTERQEGPHPHSAVMDPTNTYLYVPDLGIDKIMIYRFDPVSRTLKPNDVPSLNLTPGSGPRHFVFHPNSRYTYVIKELASVVTVLRFNPATGALERVQRLSTLPENFTDSSTCSEIQITPDGRFLYAGNRGHDSITAFAVDPNTGTLRIIGYYSTRGRTPRNFTIDPTGRFLLVGNQDSSTIVTFRIDAQTGQLEDTGYTADVRVPVCLKTILI